jgi:hypothetical protein
VGWHYKHAAALLGFSICFAPSAIRAAFFVLPACENSGRANQFRASDEQVFNGGRLLGERIAVWRLKLRSRVEDGRDNLGPIGREPPQIRTALRYTLSASGLILDQQKVVVAKQLFLIRQPDAPISVRYPG